MVLENPLEQQADCCRSPTRASRAATRGLLFAWLAFLSVLPACSEPEQTALRVGLSHWPPNELAYLAEEMGFYRGRDIHLVEFGSPGEYLPAFVSGGFDAAVISLGSALELISIDPSNRIVMLLDYSEGADALVAHSGIESAADLRGRRIGYEATALGAYMLYRFLELHDVPVKDVTAIPIDTVEQERAFLDRRIDAVVTYEPMVSRLVEAGGRVIADSRKTPEEIMDVLVARGSALTQKRAQLEAFADGWFKALGVHEEDRKAAAKLADARQHVSVDNYLRAFDHVVMIDRAANERLFSTSRPNFIAHLDRHRVFLQDAGFISREIRSESILEPSIILGGK